MVPDKWEVERRCRDGVTPREAELWLADECERAAELLRREGPTDKIACASGLAAFRLMLDNIEAAIR